MLILRASQTYPLFTISTMIVFSHLTLPVLNHSSLTSSFHIFFCLHIHIPVPFFPLQCSSLYVALLLTCFCLYIQTLNPFFSSLLVVINNTQETQNNNNNNTSITWLLLLFSFTSIRLQPLLIYNCSMNTESTTGFFHILAFLYRAFFI